MTYGPWDMTPTPISLALANGDSASDPWLSDDTNDVYFTNTTATNPSHHSIMSAHRSGGVWSAPALVALAGTTENANPFLGDDGTLWFDNVDTSMRKLYAAPPDKGGFGPPVAHLEVGAAREPSLSTSGNILYYSAANVAEIYRATSAGGGTFSAGVLLMHGTDGIEAPSISASGTMLYFTEYASVGERIFQASFDVNDTLVNEQIVGAFQTDAGGGYLAPNVTRDGRTLVFSYRANGATAPGLFYVQRPCL